jgi:hypothetical protein
VHAPPSGQEKALRTAETVTEGKTESGGLINTTARLSMFLAPVKSLLRWPPGLGFTWLRSKGVHA